MLCPRSLSLSLSLSISLSLSLSLSFSPLSLYASQIGSFTNPSPPPPPTLQHKLLVMHALPRHPPPTLGICYIWLTHVSAALARNMHHVIPHCMSRPCESSFYIGNIGKTPAGNTPRSSRHQACTELKTGRKHHCIADCTVRDAISFLPECIFLTRLFGIA